MAILYLARCRECGAEHETKSKDVDGDPCPHCKGPLRRVFAVGGVAFKGTGFYTTDKRKR